MLSYLDEQPNFSPDEGREAQLREASRLLVHAQLQQLPRPVSTEVAHEAGPCSGSGQV